jgi:predicted component of type VI protein secretion system
MELVDEDTVAPCLADADLDECFAELQHVLREKDGAIAEVEQLSNAKPDDEVYDYILAQLSGSSDVDDKAQAILDKLVRAPLLMLLPSDPRLVPVACADQGMEQAHRQARRT